MGPQATAPCATGREARSESMLDRQFCGENTLEGASSGVCFKSGSRVDAAKVPARAPAL
jgi:hypothetical protein